MRVFLTGASGYIGSAVARELISVGHEVTGMHHSPESADRLRAMGAEPVQGDLAKPETYAEVAAGHEVLIHLAMDYGRPADLDQAAVDTLIEAARSHWMRDAHLIYTSGCWILGETRNGPADEEAPIDHPATVVAWRPAHEQRVLAQTGEGAGLTPTVVRPGIVYGGKRGLVTPMFGSAAEEGAARHIGDGANRWSLVHREDLAVLYRLIVDSRAAGVFHGVDGHPMRVIEVARAASEAAGAGGKTRSASLEEARESFGPAADAMVLDQALVSARGAEIGWKPAHRSFVLGAIAAWREYRLEND